MRVRKTDRTRWGTKLVLVLLAAACGVDVTGIVREAGETFHWVGKYAPDLATRETIDTRLGVFGTWQPPGVNGSKG